MEVEDFYTLPCTKEEAKALKSVAYFTGEVCKNGHLDKRYTNTGICYACKRENIRKDTSRYPERVSECNQKSYEKQQERYNTDESYRGLVNFNSRKWAEQNRDKSNEIKKRNRSKYEEKYAERNREYMKVKRECPYKAKSMNLQKYVWAYFKGILTKSRYDKNEYLGYSFETLKLHLERQFTTEMNWSNYGTYWEIDHKIPISWFNTEDYITVHDYILDVWKIENIQPLTCFENGSKNNTFASI